MYDRNSHFKIVALNLLVNSILICLCRRLILIPSYIIYYHQIFQFTVTRFNFVWFVGQF